MVEPEQPADFSNIKLDQKQISSQIDILWDSYDTEKLGVLDKIETGNLLNELLTSLGCPTASLEQFNSVFTEFDTKAN